MKIRTDFVTNRGVRLRYFYIVKKGYVVYTVGRVIWLAGRFSPASMTQRLDLRRKENMVPIGQIQAETGWQQ